MSSPWRWWSPATFTRSTICACSNISPGRSGSARSSATPGTRTGSAKGSPALEAFAAPRAGKFLFGDAPTAADVCLVPQLYNARRFNVPLDGYPTLMRADENANRLEAFAAAHPDRQEVPQ